MRLLWLCSTLPPYNGFLFRSLSAQPDIGLQVVVNKMEDARHPWQTELTHGFNARPIRRITGIDLGLLREALWSRNTMIVIAGWNVPAVILFVSLLAVRRASFVLWTDTPDVRAYRPPLKAALRDRWLRWLFGCARAVMGTGTPALEALQEMGCPAGKLLKFPFFVDLEKYHVSRAAAPTAHGVRFVSVGRIDNAVKGHDLAVQALNRVAERTGRLDWSYTIAGDGPDLEELRSLISSSGMSERIRVTGWLEPDEVRSVLQRCDVLIHPSLRDAYPAAVLEAMATGMPVIGSNAAGSVLDRVVHMQNGWIHAAGNVSQLSEQIEWVLSNPEEVAKMGKAARLTAEQWPVSRAIEIIRSIVAGQAK